PWLWPKRTSNSCSRGSRRAPRCGRRSTLCWRHENWPGSRREPRPFFVSRRRLRREVRSRGGRCMGSDSDSDRTAVKPGAAARRIVIAIDGPAGSGKSTLAARLARKYGYTNIESGAMYRALALKAITEGHPLDDSDALGLLARQSGIELRPRGEGNQVLLDGNDVTERIRQQDVTEAASRVSVHPPVREWMVSRQQEMGAGGGIVMEGRDIGTKVFP